MSRYDNFRRGPWGPTYERSNFRAGPPPPDWRGWTAGPRYDERADPRGRLRNRVTARYNLDYVVGPRGDRYDRNYHMYGGDRPPRIGDERYYRRPYWTRGGTRTWRGAGPAIGYDHPYWI